MHSIPVKTKEAIIVKALNRGEKTLVQVAKENNVGYSSLQHWLRCKRRGSALPDSRTGIQQSTDKQSWLEHLLATAHMEEPALGAYCREQGIFSHQLEQWRKTLTEDKKNDVHAEFRRLKLAYKQLEHELNRKDKALAETTALLVLKKKADLIWGDNGGD